MACLSLAKPVREQKSRKRHNIIDYKLERAHNPHECAFFCNRLVSLRVVSREVDPAVIVNHKDQYAAHDETQS